MDQNTFTLLTGGLFLYNSTFSDVNNFRESLRERLFCKKIAKVRELVDAMHEKIVPKGVYVIREGIRHPSLHCHYSFFHCHYY